MQTDGVFDEVVEFPESSAARSFGSLVGLDDVKAHLIKESWMILDPSSLDKWEKKNHGNSLALTQLYRNRPPLFVFAGDVGTGKTALAESFGDAVARRSKIPVTMFSLGLSARGTGAVGQMTGLIGAAFSEVQKRARNSRGKNGQATAGYIFLVDEADAIAQTRSSDQMHHEDRAGVNALIRGIDDLADGSLPAIVVLCTNRLEAIDPAVLRRAAAVFSFGRPNEDQRRAVIKNSLEGTGVSDATCAQLVKVTGPFNGCKYGFTYSDLRQRLMPAILREAFPDKPVTDALVLKVADSIEATPPFGG